MKKASTYWLTSFRCFIWNVDIFFCYFRFTSTNVAWESLTVFSSPGLTARTRRRLSRSTTSSTSPPSTSRTTTTTLYQNNCCCCIYHWKLFYFFNFNLYLTHRRNFCLASLPTDKLGLYLSHWRANTFANRVANNQCVQSVSLDLFAGLCIIRGDKDLIPKLCPFNKVLFKPIFVSELLVRLDIQLGSEYWTFK